MAGQAEQERHLGPQRRDFGCLDRRLEGRVGQPGLGDGVVQAVVAQVGDDGHPLEPGLAGFQFECGFVQRHVERHRGAGQAGPEGVGLHHRVGQHGDLVAGHVDGRQAVAGHQVERAAGLEGEAGRGDVHTHDDGAAAQTLHRQGIVDFGGLRIVDREGRNPFCQGQFVWHRRRFEVARKPDALGEVVEQEPFPVELVGRGDGAGPAQQVEGCGLGGTRSLYHRLVFGCVLVGLEQDPVELVADGRRGFPGCERLRPVVDLLGLGFFTLDGRQRLLHDLRRRLAETALAGAAEVMRCLEQLDQHGGLLGDGGGGAEIVAGQVGESELFLGREFVGHFQLDAGCAFVGLRQQDLGLGFLELQQQVGGLDLHPFARGELHLGGRLGFGKDAACEKFAGFFEQCVHGAILPFAEAGNS